MLGSFFFSITLISPFFGALILLVMPSKSFVLQKLFAFFCSCFILINSLCMWFFFDFNSSFFQFLLSLKWFSFLGLNYILGVDGLSVLFIILTSFLITICLLISWNYSNLFLKEYLISFLILEGFLFQIFCVLDIFLFYIFFESVLLPTFFIIGVWGSRLRKIRAVLQFFIYTLIGSLFMLIAFLVIFFETGSTDLQFLWNINFSENRQFFLWIAFFFSFAVKIPLPPFHIWLPEAHAEAPTAGSVILAGILLKLGGYGFLRFALTLLPVACNFFSPLIFLISLLAAIYASFGTLRQIDFKKIIAYSSIAHMGIVILGLFSINCGGLEGCIFLMFSHALISSSLFLCIGFLYDRYKTRLIKYYGGLVQTMPIFSSLLLFFIFSNMGFPGTSSFISEFLILNSLFLLQTNLSIFAGLSTILSATYSIWLFNRLCFGFLKNYYVFKFQDISRREFWTLVPFVFLTIFFGFNSNLILNLLHLSVLNILNFY
uniref:NADH dehydrogenase subunit 4 n=1 Tax=Neorhodella cyanea TaxID=131155 RepID=UPI001FCD5551|nr:NADH dehydrogenase subunit 4 [Neorhodella cyanea]UNJ18804.1 NADH dehydrogenase subunit 4 [Neorhodella cyanea]